MRPTRAAFTLVELLVVITLVAILAAIAVPNFLEFQIQSKIARVESDLRRLESAFEAYQLDHGAYPIHRNYGKYILCSFPHTRPIFLSFRH